MLSLMWLALPTNWTDSVIDAAMGHSADELMGAAPSPLGHAQTLGIQTAAPETGERGRHIRAVTDAGIGFNYVVDAPCIGNREFDLVGNPVILDHLKWAADQGVTAVTVSSTFLVELVKRRLPQLKVVVSQASFIDTVEKARHFFELGADAVTVHPDANRDIPFLRKLPRGRHGDIRLIVNHGCAYQCVFGQFHAMVSGHRAQREWEDQACGAIDPCEVSFKDRLTELVKMRWIRPEDMSFYLELGFERFVVLGQGRPTPWIDEAARTWRATRFDGDLLPFLDGGIRSRGAGSTVMRTADLSDFLKNFEGSGCRNHCHECTRCGDLATSLFGHIDPINGSTGRA